MVHASEDGDVLCTPPRKLIPDMTLLLHKQKCHIGEKHAIHMKVLMCGGTGCIFPACKTDTHDCYRCMTRYKHASQSNSFTLNGSL